MAKALALLLAFLIYLFSTEPIKDLLLAPLENRYPFPKSLKELDCAYIVVLGGGIVASSPAEDGKACVREDVAKRLYVAFKVWRELGIPIVLSGGKLHFPESEASAMERFLLTLGVSKDKILKEKKSRTTFENALYVRELIGREKICLITSAYHMPRSVFIFKSFGFEVLPVPAFPYGLRSFLPNPGYLTDSMKAFREYVGIAFFTFRRLVSFPF